MVSFLFRFEFVHRFPFALIIAAKLLIGFHNNEAIADKPNIIVILADDQGYADLGINGNPYVSTPYIDSLATDGARFYRFFVNSFCAPTRAALLTGRYPVRCGVWGVTHNHEAMRPSEVTLAEAFGAAGYRTACIGKWHNGEQYPFTPTGQGFDLFFGFHNGHINNYFNTTLLRGSQPEPTTGYITDVLTDEADRFIREDSAEPFFCYLAYNAPHSPYQVPDDYYERFRAKGFDESVSAFWGMCENIDDNVGRLLYTLESTGLADNTIVIFLTDNGGTAGVKIFNAGMRGGKTSVHEGGCRVPLHIRWPGRISPGIAVTQIASHIDVFPTLLQLAGIAAPEGPPVDGTSLVPLLTKAKEVWPDRMLFTHNPISQTNRYPGAVRTEQFRLVREIKGAQGGSSARDGDASVGAWQLYDMLADPAETQDIASQYPDAVQELSQRYEQWVDDTRAEPLQQFSIPVGYEQERPVWLFAPQAIVEAPLRYANGPGFAHDWLTNWTDPNSTITFDIEVKKAGKYHIDLQYGCDLKDAGATVSVTVAGQTNSVKVVAAPAPEISLPHRDQRGRGRYRNREWSLLPVGSFELPLGRQPLILNARPLSNQAVMDLKAVRLSW